jgi:hypothetical protein
MENYEILYSGQVFTAYAQIALFDNEHKNSYPQWIVGNEAIVFGQRGVAVATAVDKSIDVKVFKGTIIPDQYLLCVLGEIIIGNKGIMVGNVPAANVTKIPLIGGRYSVMIFTDGIGENVCKVIFVINQLSEE